MRQGKGKIRWWGVCLLLLFAAGVAGCFKDVSKAEMERGEASVRTWIDAQGEMVRLSSKPQRIISCSISTDEILLGLTDTSRIAALSVLADDPGISNLVDEAKKVKNRVDLRSVEPILALKPDLVLAPDFVKPEIVQSLRDLNIPVFVYRTPKTIADVEGVIEQFAQVIGEEGRGKEMVREMERRLSRVRKKVSRIPPAEQKRAVLIRPNGAYFSPQNSISDIYHQAGIKDAMQELSYEKPMPVPQEAIVRLDPDLFFIVNWNYDGRHDPDLQRRAIMENPSYKTTKAVRNGQIQKLHGAYILSLSQYIVAAVEEVAQLSYPEIFSKEGAADSGET